MRRVSPLLLIAACTTLRPQADPGSPADWVRVLSSVDGNGMVDYERVDRASLDRYVAWLARPQEDADLAFWINAYNALVIYQVLERWPVASVGDMKKKFFYFTRFVVNGKTLSLYHIENDIVRGYGDPRIHFALNCASKSCPRLPREPFDAARLDAQLERETKRFLAEERNVKIEDGKLVLNEIFDWYSEDFKPTPVEWLKARGVRVPDDATVKFRPWDWSLNSQPD